MKKHYFANFFTSNGSRKERPLHFTNKREAIRIIVAIAKGETYLGNTASWYVEERHMLDEDGERYEFSTVAHGWIDERNNNHFCKEEY